MFSACDSTWHLNLTSERVEVGIVHEVLEFVWNLWDKKRLVHQRITKTDVLEVGLPRCIYLCIDTSFCRGLHHCTRPEVSCTSKMIWNQWKHLLLLQVRQWWRYSSDGYRTTSRIRWVWWAQSSVFHSGMKFMLFRKDQRWSCGACWHAAADCSSAWASSAKGSYPGKNISQTYALPCHLTC